MMSNSETPAKVSALDDLATMTPFCCSISNDGFRRKWPRQSFLGDWEILIRFGEILDENLPLLLYAFDGHFDVILLLCFLENGFGKLVALCVEREPLAVGKNAVAASDARFLQRALLGVAGGELHGVFRIAFGVPSGAPHVYHVASEFHLLIRI